MGKGARRGIIPLISSACLHARTTKVDRSYVQTGKQRRIARHSRRVERFPCQATDPANTGVLQSLYTRLLAQFGSYPANVLAARRTRMRAGQLNYMRGMGFDASLWDQAA